MTQQHALSEDVHPSDAPSKRRKLQLYFFDAGGGHRSAAEALIQSAKASYPGWDIELVNLQELLKKADPVYQVTGVQAETIYNAAIKRGWTYGSRPFLRALQRGIRMNAAPMKKVLRAHFVQSKPDLIVSVVPNFNKVMFDALRDVHKDVPYVTIMTDIADSPPHFWMENQDQYIIVGSHKAALQAHMSGFYRPERILETSGMILRPAFYQDAGNKPLTHQAIGLDPNKKTALIMFGGNGSIVSKGIALKLLQQGIQSIVLCGHNKQLLADLQGIEGCHAIGFTQKVADYMRLANFFIGKPGPGSMSEALHLGLPVVLLNNRGTMIQERYNIIWAEENKLGVSIDNFAHIGRAATFLLNNGRLDQHSSNARRLNNRAVFEIPKMLESIMDANPVSPPAEAIVLPGRMVVRPGARLRAMLRSRPRNQSQPPFV
ncbi:MAG: galactosyldiacylglycerol synthase [Alphaproteobacteria bacterium]|nr:galactosyldiacylglycerol synthase [Alphaproteobacteria bacterium]